MAETPVAAVARRLDLPCFKPAKASTDEGIAQIKSCRADLALIVAYGQIIRPAFYNEPSFGTYNLHFSLLPRWRGASPVPAAILAGDDISGVSLQRINEGLDTGDLVGTVSFPIKGLTAPQVFQESLRVSVPLIQNFMTRLPDISLTPQDHGKATLCGKMNRDSGRILPESTCDEVLRKSRAYEPWPGVFALAQGRRYKITAFGPQTSENGGRAPGFYRTDRRSLTLVLRDGSLPVQRLQKEGGKEMETAAFLNAVPADFSAVLDPA